MNEEREQKLDYQALIDHLVNHENYGKYFTGDKYQVEPGSRYDAWMIATVISNLSIDEKLDKVISEALESFHRGAKSPNTVTSFLFVPEKYLKVSYNTFGFA